MASSANSLLLSVLVLVLGLVVSHAVAQSLIRMVPPENLLPKGDRRARADNFRLFCDSWRLSVENNNAGAWSSIPDGCLSNVEGYVTGDKYQSDLRVAAADSLAFAKTVKIAGDGLDVWVFDIDDTLLSSLSYYQKYGFGTYNETAYEEWVEEAGAPALQPSLRLYKDLQRLGFEIVLLTGRDEYQRKATVKNLLSAGYSNWNRLYLRGDADQGKKAILYKSEKRLELVNEGYRIHGSSGDQWSDLLGFALAERSFKLPNPMYYIA